MAVDRSGRDRAASCPVAAVALSSLRVIARTLMLAVAAAGACAAPGAAADEEGFSLLGPLRVRDMTPFHLTRLEMVPAAGSAAIGDGWTIETDLTHTSNFERSPAVATYLLVRGGRKPFTERDAETILARPGDTYFLDGEIGLFAATVHYQVDRRLGFFVTLPVYYMTGGIFDGVIEDYHGTFGFPQGDRNLVTRNEFRIVYRIGREQVVDLGPPASGVSDPIFGLRYRLLPPGGPWDLIAQAAVKVATREEGALSTGGTDAGIQLAVHRIFRRQAVYLDMSVVRAGGPFPDPRVDRRIIPVWVLGYEVGLTHRTSFTLQYYLSSSVFTRSNLSDLTENKNEIVGGFRFRHGPLVWYFDVIENLVHYENTPDVGAELGMTWQLGTRR